MCILLTRMSTMIFLFIIDSIQLCFQHADAWHQSTYCMYFFSTTPTLQLKWKGAKMKQAFNMLRTIAPYLDSGCKALRCCHKCRCAVKRRIPLLRTACVSDAWLNLVPMLPNITNSGCSLLLTLILVFWESARDKKGGCVSWEWK